MCKWNPQTKWGFYLQFADYTYNLRIPLTICGLHLQLNLTIQMSYHLIVDSTIWSGLRKLRRSGKSSNVADSATDLILAFCGFRLQCTKCTVWPHNDHKYKNKLTVSSKKLFVNLKNPMLRKFIYQKNFCEKYAEKNACAIKLILDKLKM